jgi:flagellar basal-body rod modification protein FlgD
VKDQTDRFLKILLTQLKNQNPTDPMKPQEFANQLTMYSQLEQQIGFNDKLNKLLTASATPKISPLSYLNTEVDYSSDVSPVQSGKANWTYFADGSPTVINIRAEDSAGHTVYTGTGDITAGTHNINVPSTLAAGAPLKLVITATDATGKTVNVAINGHAKINAVNTVDGQTILEANGFMISGDAVTRIATPSTANAS